MNIKSNETSEELITWYPDCDIFDEITIELPISQELIHQSNPILVNECDVELDSMFQNLWRNT